MRFVFDLSGTCDLLTKRDLLSRANSGQAPPFDKQQMANVPAVSGLDPEEFKRLMAGQERGRSGGADRAGGKKPYRG